LSRHQISRTGLWIICVFILFISAWLTPSAFADPAGDGDNSDSGTSEEATSELEEQQGEIDQESAPEVQGVSEGTDSGLEQSAQNDAAVVEGFAEASTDDEEVYSGPYDLHVNSLEYATNADPSSTTFSWAHATSATQVAYTIEIFAREDSDSVLLTSGRIESAAQTSVVVAGLADALEDNQLYYWQITAEYSDGTVATSSRQAFATAVGDQWESQELVWTTEQSVAALLRTTVERPAGVVKALLSVTALDTEASRRHVYNVYVNGEEVGVGPARRQSTTVFYNTFDVTDQLVEGQNVLGAYAYSQAVSSGVLMQLTYFYADGTSGIAYNSASDYESTSVVKIDDVVYGTSNQSIGTAYYTELAQNSDTTKFPYGWNTEEDISQVKGTWSTPMLVTMKEDYTLSPSIVENSTRWQTDATSISRNSDGSYTVAFAKEILGDIQLTVSSTKRVKVRIVLGEELSNGKASSPMRTGNTYDETWTFQGTDVTYTGFSLKGFRYATIYNYPGELTLENIKGIVVGIKDGGTSSSDFSSSSELLNAIYELADYSAEATASDTVADSITRERRAYEGDNLIYQAVAYATGTRYMSVRNTWNSLLANPTQYTEYRLMTAIGIYEDYLHTADLQYVSEVYAQLKTQVDQTVVLDPNVGLVKTRLNSSGTAATVDLVDWPRTELSGYDVNGTVYKTVVNAVAYQAYTAMAALAEALGKSDDAASYSSAADTIKAAAVAKLYNDGQGAFSDGLTSTGSRINHYAVQNNYAALAFGLYEDQTMADELAESIEVAGSQESGSIYAAYFFYKGLYDTGNGNLATQILQRTVSDTRTYNSVLTTLGATIAPEAWSTASKSNMTFSHVWGAGGGAALATGAAGIEPLTAGYETYRISIQPGELKSVTSTQWTTRGNITVALTQDSGETTISTSVPSGSTAQLVMPDVSDTALVLVDGVSVEGAIVEGTLSTSLSSGDHKVVVTQPLSLTARLTSGESMEVGSMVLRNASKDAGVSALAINSILNIGSVEVSVYSRSAGWSDFSESEAATADGSEITAIRLQLSEEAAGSYSIQYRVLTKSDGWLGWAQDGAEAGSGSWNARVLGIEVNVVTAGSGADIGETQSFLDGVGLDSCVASDSCDFFLNDGWSGKASDAFTTRYSGDAVTGDWDGDGVDTVGLRSGNAFRLLKSNGLGASVTTVYYGKSSDEVLVGDWDGDGEDTLAVRRGNAYYIKNSIGGGQADQVIYYGKSSDEVLVGDWDGDGKDTLAVRRGKTYYFKNSIAGGQADAVIAYGKTSDTVLSGDWDGDGKDTLAVRRGNTYYVKNSIAGGQADRVQAYGRATDQVVVGDWNADGSDTLGVYRP
jgi:hypothetical protein